METRTIAREAYRATALRDSANGMPASAAVCQEAARVALIEAAEAEIGPIATQPDAVQQVLEEWADDGAREAHATLMRRGRTAIRRVAAQKRDPEEIMDELIPLGEGGVTIFRRLTSRTGPRAEGDRFRNVRDAQEAYTDWRDLYDPFQQAAIDKDCDYGTAYENGWVQWP